MNDPLIEIHGLSRSFGAKQALQSVALSVPPGVVLGLVGENGAGKTTLIRHILGLLQAQVGSVRVFGLDPVVDPVGVLSRVGYLSEDRAMPSWMRVSELLRYNQAFYPDWDARFADELCDMFELQKGQVIKSLSRGQLARAGLLLALAHRPDLLVLDEPSSGLDPIVRRDILAAIIRTVVDEGRTVLFSSHLLDEVQRVADRVAIMDNGQLVLSDELDTVLASHQRLTVRFEQEMDDLPELPGALSWHGSGREWTAICNGKRDALAAAIKLAGAEIVDEQQATLDEIFVARVKA